MALPQGINFRSTLAYVTDGADEEFANGSTAYPTVSAQGNNVGYDSAQAATAANRSTGVDVRLAGINYNQTANDLTFRIDLPATGSHEIRLAAGDAGAANPAGHEFRDDTTEFATVSGTNAASTDWFDASGVSRTSSADWVSNNVSITHTFTTTIFRLMWSEALTPASASNPCSAHVWIDAAAGGGAVPHQPLGHPLIGALGGPI